MTMPWLLRGIVAIALVNLVALVALQVESGWHHWLKPMHDDLRARQHEFERLLWQSRREQIVDERSATSS